MKKNRLKKFSVRFGIAFLIIVALLTYFSDTIDHMLLPKVKVTYPTVVPNVNTNLKSSLLIPIAAVDDCGNGASVFTVRTDKSGNSYVTEQPVYIKDSDDLYYEVTSDYVFNSSQVVYSVSKDIASGDRVYLEE